MDERPRSTYDPLAAGPGSGGSCESGALRSSCQTCSSHAGDARFWIVVLVLLICWIQGSGAIRCSCDYCGRKSYCTYPTSASCFVEVRPVADRSGEFWASRRGCATADRVPDLCARVPASGGDVRYSTHDGSVVFCCRSASYCNDAIIATLQALKGNLSSLPTNSALAVVRDLQVEEKAQKTDSTSSSGNNDGGGVSAGHLGLVAALSTLCTIVVLGTGVMFFCVCWRRRLQRRRAKLTNRHNNHGNNHGNNHSNNHSNNCAASSSSSSSSQSSSQSRALSSGETRHTSSSPCLAHGCGNSMSSSQAPSSPFHQVVDADGMIVSSPSCSASSSPPRCGGGGNHQRRSSGSPSALSVTTVTSTSRHSPPTTACDHLAVAAAGHAAAPGNNAASSSLCVSHAVPSPTMTSSSAMTLSPTATTPSSQNQHSRGGGGGRAQLRVADFKSMPAASVQAALHRDFPPAYDDIDRPAAAARKSIRVDLPPQYSSCCDSTPRHHHPQHHQHHQQQQQQPRRHNQYQQQQATPPAAVQRQQQWDTWDGEGIIAVAASSVMLALHTHHDVPPNRHVTDTPDCGTPLPWDCPGGGALHPSVMAATSASSRAAAAARVMHVAPPPNRTISDKV